MIRLIDKNYFNYIEAMGQMCTNPLEYLIEEYGTDVGKFIAVEKTKQYFDEQYPEVKKDLNTQTTAFKNDAITKIQQESSGLLTGIKSDINKLKEGNKTEIQLFQKNAKVNVDDYVGVHQLQSKLGTIKEKTEQKVSGLEKSILGQADVLANKQRGFIQSKKPSIPLYDKLPQCLQQKVWEEGQKKFGTEISQEKAEAEKFLKGNLSFEELKKKFGGDLPTDQIKNMSGSIEQKLNSVKKMVKLSSLDVGSLGNKVGGFF